MTCLNLGCGSRFHPTWVNLDFASTHPGVRAHDLALGIPFGDESVDVVYDSHVLEHFTKEDGRRLIRECFRVLRTGGLIRVAVPDLETIARLYLQSMEQALLGTKEGAANYEWMMIELYDQAVRHLPGGEALRHLLNDELANEEFVIMRWSVEAKKNLPRFRRNEKQALPKESVWKRSARSIYHFLRDPQKWHEAVVRRVLDAEYETLKLGRFRRGGSVHLWMYDRYSLGTLLKSVGFEEIVQRTATESFVPDWSRFHLDTEPDGTLYKPDSLFMEARKPL